MGGQAGGQVGVQVGVPITFYNTNYSYFDIFQVLHSYSWPFGKESPSCSCTKAKSGTRGSMVAKLKLEGNPCGQNRVAKVQ